MNSEVFLSVTEQSVLFPLQVTTVPYSASADGTLEVLNRYFLGKAFPAVVARQR